MSNPSSSSTGLSRTGSRLFVIIMGLVIVAVAAFTAFTVRDLANDPATRERVERIQAQQEAAAATSDTSQPADSTR